MSDRSTTLTQTAPPVEQPPFEQVRRGYRWRSVLLPDGREISVQVPLTPEDFLNPQEGDLVPESTFHAIGTTDLHSMLRLRFAADPTMAVFRDLIIRWGIPGLSEPAPDIAVIPNVWDRDRNRRTFNVWEEGTRPILIIKVVSPDYRKQDLIDTVDIYARSWRRNWRLSEPNWRGSNPSLPPPDSEIPEANFEVAIKRSTHLFALDAELAEKLTSLCTAIRHVAVAHIFEHFLPQRRRGTETFLGSSLRLCGKISNSFSVRL